MQVKKRTLESPSLTLQHKHGVSGSQYINYREALRLVLVSHMPISWTNPCCQREEVLWLVRPVWRPTGSPSQITHSEREQSPSGSKTELIKRTQSHYGLFLRLSTVRQVTHGRGHPSKLGGQVIQGENNYNNFVIYIFLNELFKI